MKKFNFKSLLVLVLALILVFSLVACGDDGGDDSSDEPAPTATFTASDYFNELWTMTSSIGNQEIASTDNVAISADLDLALNIRSSAKVVGTIDLGLKVDAVLDRTSTDGKDTAIKIQVCDPSNNDENWTTIYFFINDPNYVYFDYAGQHMCVGLELDDGTLDGETSIHANAYLGTWIKNMLSDTELNGKSISNIISMFTNDMGENWSLNTLVDNVVELLGVNLKTLLKSEDGKTIASLLKTILSLKSTDELFDANGALDIKAILTSGKLDSLFSASKTADGKTYTASLNSSIVSTLINLVGGSLPLDNISSVIGTGTALTMSFNETDDNKFDSFTLSIGLGDVKTSTTTINGTKGTFYPEIALTVNKLEFRKATTENAVKLAADKDDYKSEFDWDGTLTATIDGISLYDEFAKESYDLTGTYTLQLDASLDLKNEGTTANNTKAVASLKKDNKEILSASYAAGTLSVKVSEEATISVLKDGESQPTTMSVAKLLVTKFGGVAVEMLDGIYSSASKYIAGTSYYQIDETVNPAIYEEVEEDETFVAGTKYFTKSGETYTYAKGLKKFADGTTYYTKSYETNYMFAGYYFNAFNTYYEKEYEAAEITEFAEGITYYTYDDESDIYTEVQDGQEFDEEAQYYTLNYKKADIKQADYDYTKYFIKGYKYKSVSITEFADGQDYFTKLADTNALLGVKQALLGNDGEHYQANFTGQWTNINIQKSVADVVWGVIDGMSAANIDLKPIAETIKLVIPMINTEENKLTVSTDNLGSTVLKIGKNFDSSWKSTDDVISAILDLDTDDLMSDVTTLIKLDGVTYGYAKTADTTYVAGKTYYTKAGDVYTVATITAFAKDVDYYESTASTDFFNGIKGSKVVVSADLSADNGVAISANVTASNSLSVNLGLTIDMNAYDETIFTSVVDGTAKFVYDFSNNTCTLN